MRPCTSVKNGGFSKRKEFKRVIKAEIKANRYVHQNRDGTIQVMMEWLKINKEIAGATYDSVAKAFNEDGSLPEKGLQLAIEEAKRIGKVEVADLSILRESSAFPKSNFSVTALKTGFCFSTNFAPLALPRMQISPYTSAPRKLDDSDSAARGGREKCCSPHRSPDL